MESLYRSCGCGDIAEHHVGETLTLIGWVHKRRDHGGLIFVDLRDRSGIMQVVFSPETDANVHEKAHEMRSEYVVCIKGLVNRRSQATVNPDLATGAYELNATSLEVYNASQTLPFSLHEAEKVDEELRLTYRYLDMRRPHVQKLMKKRNDITFAFRQFLHENGFYELETPILSKPTTEGAREFLVPSRLQRHSWYVLPQSPQVYKQLLMAGGFERYFQIARCFRDEDLRADRQPEFTQLDLEMSFVGQEDVIGITEHLARRAVKASGRELPSDEAFPRITYDEAFSRYGTDRPDTRFGCEIIDYTSVFHDTQLSFLQSTIAQGGRVGGICVTDRTFRRSELDAWVATAQKAGAKGLIWLRFGEDGTPDSPVAKFLPDDVEQRLRACCGVDPRSATFFFVAGAYGDAWTVLGRVRLELGKALSLYDPQTLSFLWVTDFPLLEYDKEQQRWFAAHHPFTRPKEGWCADDPASIRADAYDLVLNGTEIGGGSLRIHEEALQHQVFDLLGMSSDEAERHFGFLMQAQRLGFPPHGGIALGLDRLIMLLCGAQSLRDVIPFPKTQSGSDPLLDAPAHVDERVVRQYGLRYTTLPH